MAFKDEEISFWIKNRPYIFWFSGIDFQTWHMNRKVISRDFINTLVNRILSMIQKRPFDNDELFKLAFKFFKDNKGKMDDEPFTVYEKISKNAAEFYQDPKNRDFIWNYIHVISSDFREYFYENYARYYIPYPDEKELLLPNCTVGVNKFFQLYKNKERGELRMNGTPIKEYTLEKDKPPFEIEKPGIENVITGSIISMRRF